MWQPHYQLLKAMGTWKDRSKSCTICHREQTASKGELRQHGKNVLVFIWERLQLEGEAYKLWATNKTFQRRIMRGCLFCSRDGGSPSHYWQSEHSPPCWQQQIREVNIRQLLQSVLSPQSVWITINKTWNAFKNSIAKSLVSSWSLLILRKEADLEEMAFSSRNTL